MNGERNEGSLNSLWRTARTQRKALEETHDRNSESYTTTLSQAIATHVACKNLVDNLNLFSLNESLEDVASGELKYLLIDFYLGDLIQRQNAPQAIRKQILDKSRWSYRRFLTLCDAYDLLSAKDKKLFEQTVDASSGAEPFFATQANAGVRREEKIAKYRLEKELKSKIETLSNRPNNDDDTDEDVTRSLHLSLLQLSIMQTFSALESIALELDMLSKAPPPEQLALLRQRQQEEDERSRQRRNNNGKDGEDYSDRVDPSEILSRVNGPLLASDGKPLRPFTLLDNRQKVKSGVFGSGHRLPTMTIDEYLEEERKRGGMIEGGGEQSGIQPEPDEDNYELADQETMKAREWDEFKEANPKGSGNTLNRG